VSRATATLRCPCGERCCITAFEYLEPPRGETHFELGGVRYGRRYDQCRICGHYFSRHELDLRSLYESGYVDATYGGERGMRERFKRVRELPAEDSDNAARVDRVQGFARRHFGERLTGRSLLDVGAGIGVFPDAMKRAGWKVATIESDPRAVRHLREFVGVEAWGGQLRDLARDDRGHFDVVTFNKVLEHVEDPVDLLGQAAGVVADGGFVYVELPDVAAAAEGPEREEFFIEHYHVFSPQSLAMLAVRAGFSVVGIERVREPSTKYTLRGFLVR